MPLHILIILVVGGIAGITVLLHGLGYSRSKQLQDSAMLRDEWLRHFPEDSFDDLDSFEFLISSNKDRAILRSDQGYGLLWAMGADTAARRLDTLRWKETRTGLAIRFDDPGAPSVHIRLDPADRPLWNAYVRSLDGPELS
ncbi:MAG: hypothetical protein AAFR45_05650 [Pseudomonadota bacterium]